MEDEQKCEELVRDICSACGIASPGKRIYPGSRILYETSQNRIVKVFPKEEPSFCRNESGYLKLLQGKLGGVTPELLEIGEFDGYPFLVMKRVSGLPLTAAWTEFREKDKKRFLRNLALLLNELHSLPPELAPCGDIQWCDFIRNQLDRLESNHRKYGLEGEWTDRICRFIEKGEAVEFISRKVICHTELMREHLFVSGCGNNIRISGLIDFEPSMVAVPEYDFCSVGLFISAGEKGLFRYFLKCYGYDGKSEGIMRMLLLHRYSNMKRFISTIPVAVESDSIENLCRYWY